MLSINTTRKTIDIIPVSLLLLLLVVVVVVYTSSNC